MSITWNDLTVNFEHLDRNKLMEDWQWLVGTALPFLITSTGDAFLQTESGEIYWLITGSAEYEKVANTYEAFEKKLKDNELLHEWFLVELVAELKEKGLLLEEGQIYGFKKLPAIGGEYELDNFEPTDIEVYFSMSGQMNQQIKGLPDGTKINNVSVTE